MPVAAPRHSDGVSAGCAPSGLALHLRQRQVRRRCEMPVARPNSFAVAYLDRRRLKARTHGRPRSDRKKRFLLSAVAPSTSARHPREARPINWAQCGGLASGGEALLLTPRPHFTAPPCTLGNQVLVLRTALLFVKSAVRLVYAELLGPVAVCSRSKHSAIWVIRAGRLRAGT
jgi:hypothetical protein